MIGIDLVEVDRFDNLALFDKIGREEERDYVFGVKNDNLKRQKLASLFCVKEALVKALGLGGSGVSMKDFCLCHDESGRPEVKLYGKAKEVFEKNFLSKQIAVSLSHTKKYVTAIAIIC